MTLPLVEYYRCSQSLWTTQAASGWPHSDKDKHSCVFPVFSRSQNKHLFHYHCPQKQLLILSSKLQSQMLLLSLLQIFYSIIGLSPNSKFVSKTRLWLHPTTTPVGGKLPVLNHISKFLFPVFSLSGIMNI